MNCHRCDATLGPEPQLLRLSRWHVFLCDSCHREAESHLDDCARRAELIDACTAKPDCPCVRHAEARILQPIPTPGLCHGCQKPVTSTTHLCADCRISLDVWIDAQETATAEVQR